jgi:hypothetical protein
MLDTQTPNVQYNVNYIKIAPEYFDLMWSCVENVLQNKRN